MISGVERAGGQGFLKRHIYGVVLGVVALVLLGLTGLALTQTTELVVALQRVNVYYLLFWRMAFYLSVFCVWRLLVRRCLRRRYGETGKDFVCVIKDGRKKIVLLMIVFELLIVQNLFGLVIGWLWGDVDGG